jgi:methanogenic corrinoid protein MtbC1
LPGEEHTLGLLMAEATMSLCGAHCTMLGVQTPISEIVLAAKAHQADVLTLSFSSAMPAAQVKSGVEQVRKALPKSVAIWLGGAGAIRQRSILPGVQLMGALSDLTEAVVDWRKTVAGVNF